MITYPDLYGSIGGFLYGFLASMAMLPREFKQNGAYICRDVSLALIGIIGICVMTAILIVVFFAGPPT